MTKTFGSLSGPLCTWLCKVYIITPSPIHRGTGYCFRSISLFVSFFLCFFICVFLCFFVSKITRKRMDRFAWNFQGRCGVTMTTWFYFRSIRRNRTTPRCTTRGRVLLCFSTTACFRIVIVIDVCLREFVIVDSWVASASSRRRVLDQSSSIRIIRIIFLESYARILTYETLSYVNHIVAWYFRPVQGSSSLDFNHETFTQNRNSFAKSNTPLLETDFSSNSCRRTAILRRLLTAADFVWKCHAPSRYWCLVVKAFRMDLVLPADLCRPPNNTRIIRVFYIFNNTHVF